MIIDIVISITFITLNILCSFRACNSDHKYRTISNNLCKLIVVINSIAACYYGYILQSTLTTAIIFLVLVVVWLFGCFGAGDIKLLCAFLLGIKPELTIACLVMVGGLGGVQLVVMYLIGLATNKSLFEKGIPYGIPISISGFACTTLSFLSF
ncbi:prepilin peptidase [Vibrio bivalvicida]|uniref:Prepilin peptidase n=1 Tax=Vibrio bivalvicida TaxID=1276888 RepID=A0ABV4MHI7_9VIBR